MKPKSLLYAIIAILIAFPVTSALSEDVPESPLKSKSVTSTGQEKSSATSKKSSTQKKQKPVDTRPTLERIEAAIRDLKPKPNKLERERQNHREISDLNAQQDMALWAKAMFWATFATVVITSFALLLLWRTLIHTRIASEAAKEMVDEARKTTVAAQNTYKSDRAWMTYDGMAVSGIAKPEAIDKRTGIAFSIKMINSGRSPATGASFFQHFKVIPPNNNVPVFNMPGDFDDAVRGVVACNKIAAGIASTISLDQLEQCALGKANIFIHVICLYNDIFGDAHKTEACIQIKFKRPFNLLLEESFDSNIFTYFLAGKQNSAD